MNFAKAVLLTFLAFATWSCSSAPSPAVYKLGYRQSPGGGANGYVMMLAGTDYKTREAFTAAVAKLPPRSRIYWNTGCIAFREIPLGPAPRMSIEDFEKLCRSHRIRFEYICGLPSEPVITKSFSVAPTLAANRPDAQKWLEAQGVNFGPGTKANWESRSGKLTIRNTEEQIDLVARILEFSQGR